MGQRLLVIGPIVALFLLSGCSGYYKVYEVNYDFPGIPPIGIRHVVIPEGKSYSDQDIREWVERQFENEKQSEVHYSFYTDEADAKASACERPPDQYGVINSCDGVINTQRPSYQGSIIRRK